MVTKVSLNNSTEKRKTLVFCFFILSVFSLIINYKQLLKFSLCFKISVVNLIVL